MTIALNENIACARDLIAKMARGLMCINTSPCQGRLFHTLTHTALNQSLVQKLKAKELTFLVGFRPECRHIGCVQFHFHFLTHCGLVTPYGITDLGQHWFR